MTRAAAVPDRRARPGARRPLPPRTTKPARLDLTLQYAAPRRGLPARASIERWLDAALDRPATLTVRIVGTAEGRRLNRTFRARDYATNVLTFVYETAPALSGDIVLCAPVIGREAREQGKPLVAHLAHLVVHGALHLQGLDHERDADARRMEAREKAILARLGYPDPYRTIPPHLPARAATPLPLRTPAPSHGRRA
jgi:probable rRNA maturation factor